MPSVVAYMLIGADLAVLVSPAPWQVKGFAMVGLVLLVTAEVGKYLWGES